MLTFRTPNGELACAKDWQAADGFMLSVAKSSDFEAPVRIVRPFQSANERSYHITYLSTSNAHEDAVVDLVDKESGDRFGIVIPIQALSSLSHSRADDEYFEAVASAIIPLIIKDEYSLSRFVEWRSDEPYELSDFFPDSTVVMAVRSDLIGKYPTDQYLPSLFANGYCVLRGDEVCSFIADFQHSQRRSLRLSRVSDCYMTSGYIAGLYRDVLPQERSDLAFFVLLYQIFEALMQHVFEDNLSEFKQRVGAFNGSPSDLRELSSILSEVASERDRIRICVERSKFRQADFPELARALDLFLKAASKTSRSSNFYDLIYDVRNLVFHGHREIPREALGMMAEINSGLARIMPKILAIS